MYQLEIDPRVLKDLARIPAKDRGRIEAAISALGATPRPAGCLPVQGAPEAMYRVRVGDFRVLYVIQDDIHLVTIARVKRRREDTYRGLS